MSLCAKVAMNERRAERTARMMRQTYATAHAYWCTRCTAHHVTSGAAGYWLDPYYTPARYPRRLQLVGGLDRIRSRT